MIYSAAAIANKFIQLADEHGKQLTNMQLQKLVFIANGFTLGIYQRPLYFEDTYAWQWGPVVPELYEALRKYGRNKVSEPVETSDSVDDNGAESMVIQAVWTNYGHLSGYQLSALTHEEGTPWSTTWHDDDNKFGIISQQSITEYYRV